MPPPPPMRVIERKGKKVARRAKAASGFDYPTKQVARSTWTGTDGKPVTIYYDPSTGAAGLAAALYVASKIDDVMKSCDVWFGVRGLGGNIILAPDFGGAYHYGCSFDQGGDWYLSLSENDTTVGLAVAEITESYMGLQGAGWDCGGSGGEALSRVLAEIATGGPDGAMRDYTSGPSWDGSNWIDRDSGTDQDYPSTGCGVLYLWWMLQRGKKLERLVQCGEPDGTLASNYNAAFNMSGSDAWKIFKAACAEVGAPGSISSDNPFGPVVVPYPASPTPPPPPPPPPDGGIVTLNGILNFFGQELPMALTGSIAQSAGHPVTINTWAVIADLAAIYSDIRAKNWPALAVDVSKLLADLGATLTRAERLKLITELSGLHIREQDDASGKTDA